MALIHARDCDLRNYLQSMNVCKILKAEAAALTAVLVQRAQIDLASDANAARKAMASHAQSLIDFAVKSVG